MTRRVYRFVEKTTNKIIAS